MTKSPHQIGTELVAVIDAPHFYCGIVLRQDHVVEAAPIVKYMKGWSRDRVREYCQKKNWKVAVVASVESAEP